ncbi:MAG: permease [Gemmatimonadetes bacterium]|nr:permease [Gemmatimonadota bacterium]
MTSSVAAQINNALGIASFRSAARSLVRAPIVSSVTIATLAVGIASVCIVYAFADAALLRPMPYIAADRALAVSEMSQGRSAFSSVSYDVGEILRHRTRAFSRLSIYRDVPAIATTAPGTSRSIVVTQVDTGLFRLLNANPRTGRLLLASEYADRSAVLVSHHLASIIGSNGTDVLGAPLNIADRIYTVVGVMPPLFAFGEADRSDAWIPLDLSAVEGTQWYAVVGMLAPGVSRGTATDEAKQLTEQIRREDASKLATWRLVVRNDMLDRPTRAWGPALLFFFGASLCVLLTACSNAGCLLLVRAVARRRETATRVALGASRRRLTCTALLESGMLAGCAALLALLLTSMSLRAIGGLIPLDAMPRWFKLEINMRVMLIASLLAIVTLAIVGSVPLRVSSSRDLMSFLRAGGDGASTSSRSLRAGIRAAVLQLILSLLLCMSCALFYVSFRRVAAETRGVDTNSILAIDVRYADSTNYESNRRAAADHLLADRLLSQGVYNAVATRSDFRRFIDSALHGGVADEIVGANKDQVILPLRFWPRGHRYVSSDSIFAVLGLRIVQGRGFTGSDSPSTPLVAVVSQRLAEMIRGGSAIGARVRFGSAGTPIEVIGVVSDIQIPTASPRGLLVDRGPDIYLSERQAAGATPTLLARARGDASAYVASTASLVGGQVPQAREVVVRPLSEVDDEIVVLLRLFSRLLGACSLVVIVLALTGVVGTVRYALEQQRRELAIRIAFGACERDLRWLVALRVGRIVRLALLIGTPLAIVEAVLLRALVFDLARLQWVAYATGVGAVVVIALVAAIVPSRQLREDHLLLSLRA